MTEKQRVDAVLAGQKPDRPPFSFWYHFRPEQTQGTAAVQAHLDHVATYHPDFLKVMNDNPYPHAGPIATIDDLASLKRLAGDEEGFGRQLELIAELRRQLGDQLYLSTTIFNAWMVLKLLVQPPSVHLPPSMDAAADAPSRWIRDAYATDPAALSAALRMIGENLARFAARCLSAGADGIFLSVRDDWVDVPGAAPAQLGLYNRLVRPTDLRILSAAAGGVFNMLHICGRAVDFRSFARYPVAVINWADRAAGPSIADVAGWARPAICAGVDNLATLPDGTPEDVRREVLDALQQAQDRPIMIAAGCTFDPDRVPAANLQALAEAARSARYA